MFKIVEFDAILIECFFLLLGINHGFIFFWLAEVSAHEAIGYLAYLALETAHGEFLTVGVMSSGKVLALHLRNVEDHLNNRVHVARVANVVNTGELWSEERIEEYPFFEET